MENTQNFDFSHTFKNRGDQPIRVLKDNLSHTFVEKLIGKNEFQKSKDQGLLTGRINYIRAKEGISERIYGRAQTPYVDAKGIIYIHETFMSYLWCISYVLMVHFEELVHTHIHNQHFPNQKKLPNYGIVEKSFELLQYTKGLIVHFEAWSEDLPNPEKYNAEDQFYVERTNSLYGYAMGWILCHEYAHIVLNHFSQAGKTQLQKEKEADEYANNCILKMNNVTEQEKQSARVGSVAGLCSLLFFQEASKTLTHPAPHLRVKTILDQYNLGEDPLCSVNWVR